jgi:hypothetical protein
VTVSNDAPSSKEVILEGNITADLTSRALRSSPKVLLTNRSSLRPIKSRVNV